MKIVIIYSPSSCSKHVWGFFLLLLLKRVIKWLWQLTSIEWKQMSRKSMVTQQSICILKTS